MKTIFNEKSNLILDTTCSLIMKYGYDKTSVADIAKEAGIGKGTIYLHFKSKDDLIESLLERELYKHNDRWADLIESDPNGGLLSRVSINSMIAMHKSDFMKATFKKDHEVFGTYLKKPNSYFRKNSSNIIRKEFVENMQSVNCIRKDLDPSVIAHIMDMFAYSLVTIGDVKNKEDVPAFNKIMKGLAVIFEDSFTPKNGGDSEGGKAAFRSMVTQ